MIEQIGAWIETVIDWAIILALVAIAVMLVLRFPLEGWAIARRGRALKRWASANDFDWTPDDNECFTRLHAPFEWYRQPGNVINNHRDAACHTMTRRLDVAGAATILRIADALVPGEEGAARATRLLATLPFDMPETSINVDRIDLGDRFNRVRFEDAAFSRTTPIGSESRRFAYALVHPLMIEFLRERPTLIIEIRGRTLMLRDRSDDGLLTPKRLTERTDTFIAFLKLVPRHLIEDLANSGCEKP